jgi:hypothetical protein
MNAATGVLDPPTLRLPVWISYSSVLLASVYLSRFVPDVVLLPFAAAFLLIGAVRLNRTGLALVLGVCVFISAQNLLLGGRLEHPAQVAHLILVLFLALAVDDVGFDPRVLLGFCRVTTALNVALMTLAWVPPLASLVYWGADRGVARYMSILPEPSFVGLYSVLNFFVLFKARQRAWAFANLLPMAASFSFAGAIAFALLGAAFIRSMWRPALVAAVALALLLLGFFLVAPEMFTTLLVNRVVGAASGGDDESLVLRVFAPLDLIRFTFTGPPQQILLGLGLGNVEHYIYYEQAALDQHWRASGARTVQPDSVFAFVLSAFGMVGVALVALFVVWLALARPSRRYYAPLRPFLVAVVLFTGLYVSLHFWVWIFLLRHEKSSSENSSAGT